MKTKGTRKSCQCPMCQSACQHKPGWFKPNEVKKAADYLGLTIKEFFSKYLGIDFWGGKVVFVLTPATIQMRPGSVYPYDPQGQCVFFKRGKCEIHPVKPFECKQVLCCDEKARHNRNPHREAKAAWDNPKAREMIKDLYEREPEVPTGSF